LILLLSAKKEYFVKMECNLLNTNDKDLLRIGLLDVTREVRNEQQLIESRERYRAVADFAYHWEYWQDPEGRLLYMSPSCERITGYNRNDFFLNPKLIENIIHPDDKDIFNEHNKIAVIPIEKAKEHFADIRIIRKDGEIRWVGHVCQNIFNDDGAHLGLRVTNKDITERKSMERKLADQQLVMSDILESTLSGYWDWNIPANVEYFSPAFKKMFGYEYHELPNVPESWQKLIFPEDLPGVLDVYDKHIQSKGESPFYNEVRYKHKDGSTVWVICAGRVIEWNDDGTPVRMVGCHVDITQRKMLEEKLKENELMLKQKNEEYTALNRELLVANEELHQTSDKLFQNELKLKYQVEESAAQNEELIQINEELQSLTEDLSESNERNSALVGANPDLMFVFDKDGVFLDYHSPDPKILLLKPSEFLNRNANEVLPGYLADITRHAITQLFETGEPQGYSYTIETKGEEKHFDARMVKYGNNNALTIIRDVTDQKIADEKLRQSQETYLGIINSVSESIYVQDENGVFLEVNDAAIASYGLKREDMIGKTPEILSAEGKNDLALVTEMVKKAFNGEPQRFEFWGRKTDGTVFPNEVTLTKGVYFGKSVVIALARDISERKKAEEALRESEERFQQSMEATNDGLWDWDVKTDMAYFSPAFFTMLGYQVGEFPATGGSWKNLLHPDDKETALQKANECIEGITNSYEVEFRLKAKDGDWLWVLSRGKCAERDKMGKAVRIVGTHVNINERKNAENEILKRELLLNKIFDVLPIGLWFADEKGKLLRGNPAGVRIWGAEPK
jgi:PAS domain S-box-containing protein